MGTRLLKRWIHLPLQRQEIIKHRYLAIEQLQSPSVTEALQTALKSVGDIERITSRIALLTARPRDLIVLRDTLYALPSIQSILINLNAPRLKALRLQTGEHQPLAHLLTKAIIDNPPVFNSRWGCYCEWLQRKIRCVKKH